MAKELSEMLADLSQQAKRVEDEFASIADETDARAEERREKARAAATAAVSRVDEGVSSAATSVSGHWQEMKDRLDAEIQGMQQAVAERRHARDVQQAEDQAQAAQARAERAVSFAAAAIQAAGVAVLDAAAARREADAMAR